MVYLKAFSLPSVNFVEQYINDILLTCVNNDYPFRVFTDRGLDDIRFEPITIFCGGNGCGKTTLLNVIAEKLGVARGSAYNRSTMFEDYIDGCSFSADIAGIPNESRIITSDDVFDFMLDLRAYNEGVDSSRDNLMKEYLALKQNRSGFQLGSMDDYEQLKKLNDARSRTMSKYVKSRNEVNIKSKSNGESAFAFFTSKIQDNALYLLDEPENSLSAQLQIELLQYLENAVRFFNCQLVMSTHSPFLLSLRGARIYDLDETPIRTARWTQLENVKTYYNFFMQNASRFDV